MAGLDAVRVAQEAEKMASSAMNQAQKAMAAVETHEQVCAERYKNIHEKLEMNADDVEMISESLKDIQDAISKGRGAYQLFSYACTAIAAAGAIVEMYHYFH